MVLLSTKTKDAIKKEADLAGMDVSITLHNIAINGEKRGCYGFVKNPANGTTVYIDTEPSCAIWLPPYLYRYAKDEKDYTGYRNRFAKTLPELARSIVELLSTAPETIKEERR